MEPGARERSTNACAVQDLTDGLEGVVVSINYKDAEHDSSGEGGRNSTRPSADELSHLS
jgi:hypothetical protein